MKINSLSPNMFSAPFITMLTSVFAVVVMTESASHDFLGSFCTGITCDNGMECLSTIKKGACDSTELYESLCTCGGAGGESDPYFSGFSGQNFYFPAEAGEIYNLLSAQDHLINAEFVDTELPLESDLVGLVSGVQNSSFIGAIGVQHGEAKVAVASDRDGKLSISIDGEELDLERADFDFAAELQMSSNITIIIENDHSSGQQVISIQTGLVVLTVFVNPVHLDNMGNEVRGHLDVQMGLNATRASAPPAHGILGQTVDPSVTSPVKDKFPGAGRASDYVVSSLFASDYAYNMFGQTARSPSPSLSPSQSLSLKPAGVPQLVRFTSVTTSRRLLESHSQEPTLLLQAGIGKQSYTSATQ